MKIIHAAVVCIFVLFVLAFSGGCSKSPSNPSPTPVPTVCSVMGGNDSGPSNMTILNNGSIYAVSFTASDNATLTSLHANISNYTSTGTQLYALALYTNDSEAPHTLLYETPPHSFAIGWNSVTITPQSVLQGVKYWIVYAGTGNRLYGSSYGTPGPWNTKYMTFDYLGSMPASTSAASWVDSPYLDASVYAVGCR